MRFVVVLVLLALLACTKTPAEAPASVSQVEESAPPPAAPVEKPADAPMEKPPLDPRVERAQQALAPLKQSLKKALTDAMQEGPEKAVSVCHSDAGKLTAAASTDGVKLGRTSHKLRNPDNAQADWMRLLYAKLREGEAPPPYMVAELPDGSFGYLEPIVTQPLCLTCHGADIPPAVTKILDERYPKDDARGFAVGELRGAWWAVVPKT